MNTPKQPAKAVLPMEERPAVLYFKAGPGGNEHNVDRRATIQDLRNAISNGVKIVEPSFVNEEFAFSLVQANGDRLVVSHDHSWRWPTLRINEVYLTEPMRPIPSLFPMNLERLKDFMNLNYPIYCYKQYGTIFTTDASIVTNGWCLEIDGPRQPDDPQNLIRLERTNPAGKAEIWCAPDVPRLWDRINKGYDYQRTTFPNAQSPEEQVWKAITDAFWGYKILDMNERKPIHV